MQMSETKPSAQSYFSRAYSSARLRLQVGAQAFQHDAPIINMVFGMTIYPRKEHNQVIVYAGISHVHLPRLPPLLVSGEGEPNGHTASVRHPSGRGLSSCLGQCLAPHCATACARRSIIVRSKAPCSLLGIAPLSPLVMAQPKTERPYRQFPSQSTQSLQV